MARILYWNIQQFGINKINEESRKRKRNGNQIITPESIRRKEVIRTTLIQNTPDIFVVVETTTGAGASGTLVSAGGASGALFLLQQMRTWLSKDWMLVPPLRLGIGGVQEGISVFYNSAVLNFTGPWGWQGGSSPANSVATIRAGNLAKYTEPWTNCLPVGNTPGGGNAINPNIPYRKLAGQWQFRGPAGAPIVFPNNFNRTPFLTTFWDVKNARTIKLMSFHASPRKAQAANGTNALANVLEMTENLADDEVGVIVGDFNVDIFNTHYEPIAYDRLLGNLPKGANYTRAVNPTANQWPDKGYVCTMLRPYYNAMPWDTNGYPGYEYVAKKNFSSVDNVLTRYGSNAGGPAANITIVNRVTGTPYNRITNPPGNAPEGHYVYDSGMAKNIANLPVALPLPPFGPHGVGGYNRGDIGAFTRFQGWANYRRIRSTSDHMALIIKV